jgi:hypothetical protein
MKFIFLLIIISLSIFSQSSTNNRITEFGVFNFTERNQIKPAPEIKKDRMDNKVLSPCFSYFQLPRNGYKFNIGEKNVIVTKKGARITIPPGAFLYTNFAYASGVGTIYFYEVTEPFEYMIAGVNHIHYDKYNRVNYLELGGMFRIEAYQDNARLRLANGKTIEVEFPDIATGKRHHFFMLDDSGNWIVKKEFGQYEIYKPESPNNKSVKVLGTRKGEVEHLTWYAFGMPYKESTTLNLEWEDPKKIAGRNFQLVVIGTDHLSYFSKWSETSPIVMPALQNKNYKAYLCDDLGNYSLLDEFKTTNKIGYDYLPESSDNFKQPLPMMKVMKLSREHFVSPSKFKTFMQIPTYEFTVEHKLESNN